MQRAENNHFEIINIRGQRETPNTRNEVSGNNINNPPHEFDEEIKLIIGITIGGILPRWVGAHAFVMYINDPNNPERGWRSEVWEEDIMLDASGHYGIGNFRSVNSDIVTPANQHTISINSYRRWFDQQENETLYTYLIEKEFGRHIHRLIEEMYPRTRLQCAFKASTLMLQSGLFEGIRIRRFPARIKDFLDVYVPEKKNIMKLVDKSSYDLSVPPPVIPILSQEPVENIV